MLEHPSQADGIAFGIAGSSDGIESEADAENSSDRPVGDAVAEEVKEGPGCEHGYDGCKFGVGGLRQSESGTSSCEPGDLHGISGNDGDTAKDLSSRK